MPNAPKTDYSELGYYRVASVSPPLFLGEPIKNAEVILKFAQAAAKQGAGVVVFPELALTGYTVEDFLHNDELLLRVRGAINSLKEKSKKLETIMIVGAPFQDFDGRLYNCAFVIAQGQIWGAVPKIHLPNYKEFYEKRWFISGRHVETRVMDPHLGDFPLSAKQLFRFGEMIFAIEICEDFFAPIKPSNYHALAGASTIFNLSASNDLIGKSEWRREKVRVHSGDNNLAYVYASSGPLESTKDTVFGGHLMIAENGSMLQESRLFSLEGDMILADIDVKKLMHERRINGTLSNEDIPKDYHPILNIPLSTALTNLARTYSRTPFVPDHPSEIDLRAKEIFEIMSTGLARRLMATKSKHMVLGLSGGLDSTLALLVCLDTAKKLGRKPSSILTITMPGYGTTAQTRSSAEKLAEACGARFETISIEKAVEQHFKDIGHDPKNEDLVFENAQARERTQILFDRANAEEVKGLVVGTGDMSECWLGWSTYNGDHMSGYDVNASIPKTLVKHLVSWYAKQADETVAKVLSAILDTPISPELKRPGKKGEIVQKTEEKVGPYLLHDFFLYHHLRNGFGPRKIFEIAALTFEKEFDHKTIAKWLGEFFQRGYRNQFKRTAIPGGPKVGTVSISPRADLRLPDEMLPEWILEEIESLT